MDEFEILDDPESIELTLQATFEQLKEMDVVLKLKNCPTLGGDSIFIVPNERSIPTDLEGCVCYTHAEITQLIQHSKTGLKKENILVLHQAKKEFGVPFVLRKIGYSAK